MEREYRYLLHLLGAYLRQEAPEPPEQLDWTKLIQLATIHNVAGILGYMAISYPICPDAALVSSLRRRCLATIAGFSQRTTLADAMVQALEEAGIDHILMKGYVLRDLYPVPELRTFGDVDIVIRPEDRSKSHELMLSRNYRADTDWEPVFSYSKEMEHYEFHIDIMEIDASLTGVRQTYFRRMWEHAVPVSAHSYRFTPEFHFLYLLTHIAKHIHHSGAGARMYLDIAAFIRHFRDCLNWQALIPELEKLELLDFAEVVFGAVEDWFGIPCPISRRQISPELLRDFTEFTLEAGVFGRSNRETGVNTLKRHDRPDTPRFFLLFRRLFPPVRELKARYTYLQKMPFLLPFAWIHRLILTRKHYGKHLHDAGVILSAESEEVQRLKRIIRDIGL